MSKPVMKFLYIFLLPFMCTHVLLCTLSCYCQRKCNSFVIHYQQVFKRFYVIKNRFRLLKIYTTCFHQRFLEKNVEFNFDFLSKYSTVTYKSGSVMTRPSTWTQKCFICYTVSLLTFYILSYPLTIKDKKERMKF